MDASIFCPWTPSGTVMTACDTCMNVGLNTVETFWKAVQEKNFWTQREGEWWGRTCKNRAGQKGEKNLNVRILLVCGFGGGLQIHIFILGDEVSGLRDHNKHSQTEFQLWLRWLQGVWTVGGGLWMLCCAFATHPPHPLQQLLMWAIGGILYTLIQLRRTD